MPGLSMILGSRPSFQGEPKQGMWVSPPAAICFRKQGPWSPRRIGICWGDLAKKRLRGPERLGGPGVVLSGV